MEKKRDFINLHDLVVFLFQFWFLQHQEIILSNFEYFKQGAIWVGCIKVMQFFKMASYEKIASLKLKFKVY